MADLIETYDKEHHVMCMGCGASGPLKDTPEEAAEAWERRATKRGKRNWVRK